MHQATPTFMDRLIGELDAALRTVAAPAQASRANPGAAAAESDLAPADRDRAGRLMRVNHAGEIAAQALYRGQALMAREPALREALLAAARDEHDHLVWCEERVGELGRRVSVLAPVWYLGSLAIGAVAALAGDRASLGFLAETERQVTAHLDGHLARLPPHDERSRRIVEQMRVDEAQHHHRAIEGGGVRLPAPVRLGMRLAARVMTAVAYRI